MKNLSSALLAFLNGNTNTSFKLAELYTITLVDGTVLTYSDVDLPLTYNVAAQSTAGGRLYNPLGGMRLMRDRVKMVVGTQVDSLDITFFPDTTDQVKGNGFIFSLATGALDGAWVSVDRAFLTSWSSAGIVGTANVFAGRAADVVAGRTSVKMTVKSPLELLNLNMPRNLYQPGCIHNLFDAGCGLSQTAFTVNRVVGSSPQTGAINSNLVSLNTTYYLLGFVTFTSGVLNGQSRAILSWNNVTGAIVFGYPFWVAPAPGDTFNAVPGCDHTQAVCDGKFANKIHFKGMPYIPQPETAT